MENIIKVKAIVFDKASPYSEISKKVRILNLSRGTGLEKEEGKEPTTEQSNEWSPSTGQRSRDQTGHQSTTAMNGHPPPVSDPVTKLVIRAPLVT
ncbi:hypothetical protein RRG08_059111 [Elysia crispata]|uniref:Uncharacterized protein n=1 Tax=Elysia crispata TaxID=231223 RepID=A0AAE1AY45_9GAST|nr:hypothetical protein RRG08_059111 [Elysia crispata]